MGIESIKEIFVPKLRQVSNMILVKPFMCRLGKHDWVYMTRYEGEIRERLCICCLQKEHKINDLVWREVD